ncbi:amino acid--tRNA ligase-related protein [Phorcysia thermohydrogeniphila]|uniref:Lysyl-tRNA synthetase class 2 n=1 Tax=Phorcysia thermohydrogeniphila TaxID=936138 RepID=A0A4R1GAU4_9BACT|nr:amino acid--tRNA ligase-related protein [Phorcysia thermohydrogeniphila]TCK05357.1 lysyl-tRNA synthetase class 2 [Phorcysia thermohydrogeniphila]
MEVEILSLRSRALKAVRDFFYSQGFLEVETPLLVPYENPDSNVKNVKVPFQDFAGKSYHWYLHTSPEFFMKRLLWYGAERIFQVCKVFRDGEVTDTHNVEFTMVEWYRVDGDYRVGMAETLELVKAVLEACGKVEFLFKGKKVKPSSPLYLTVSEAFREFAGVKDVFDEEEVRFFSKEENYEDGFFKLLVERVEPALSEVDVPVFLYDYPKKFSAMAKVKGNFAERFELYIAGLEVANGYTELTDFEDYRRKFLEKGEKAVDLGFLELLRRKPLPPCEGVALGFDRLLMLILGAPKISDVIPFTVKRLTGEITSLSSLP